MRTSTHTITVNPANTPILTPSEILARIVKESYQPEPVQQALRAIDFIIPRERGGVRNALTKLLEKSYQVEADTRQASIDVPHQLRSQSPVILQTREGELTPDEETDLVEIYNLLTFLDEVKVANSSSNILQFICDFWTEHPSTNGDHKGVKPHLSALENAITDSGEYTLPQRDEILSAADLQEEDGIQIHINFQQEAKVSQTARSRVPNNYKLVLFLIMLTFLSVFVYQSVGNAVREKTEVEALKVEAGARQKLVNLRNHLKDMKLGTIRLKQLEVIKENFTAGEDFEERTRREAGVELDKRVNGTFIFRNLKGGKRQEFPSFIHHPLAKKPAEEVLAELIEALAPENLDPNEGHHLTYLNLNPAIISPDKPPIMDITFWQKENPVGVIRHDISRGRGVQNGMRDVKETYFILRDKIVHLFFIYNVSELAYFNINIQNPERIVVTTYSQKDRELVFKQYRYDQVGKMKIKEDTESLNLERDVLFIIHEGVVLATHFGSKMVNQEAIQATAKRENALMRNKQP